MKCSSERGQCFGFLGFEFRYLRGLSGAMRPHYTPKLKKRTALVRALKEVFGQHRSQPIRTGDSADMDVSTGDGELLRGGAFQRVLQLHRSWVEKKVRRHLAHAKRKGFDWERWNRRWLYDTLGLFNAYRVTQRAEESPGRIGPISFGVKQNGGAQCGKSARCVTWRRLETWCRLQPEPHRRASPRPYR